jgi:hypothetical protein
MHASVGGWFSGVFPGINNEIIGAVRTLCENAPQVSGTGVRHCAVARPPCYKPSLFLLLPLSLCPHPQLLPPHPTPSHGPDIVLIHTAVRITYVLKYDPCPHDQTPPPRYRDLAKDHKETLAVARCWYQPEAAPPKPKDARARRCNRADSQTHAHVCVHVSCKNRHGVCFLMANNKGDCQCVVLHALG